jgi:hypothetical protein
MSCYFDENMDFFFQKLSISPGGVASIKQNVAFKQVLGGVGIMHPTVSTPCFTL